MDDDTTVQGMPYSANKQGQAFAGVKDPLPGIAILLFGLPIGPALVASLLIGTLFLIQTIGIVVLAPVRGAMGLVYVLIMFGEVALSGFCCMWCDWKGLIGPIVLPVVAILIWGIGVGFARFDPTLGVPLLIIGMIGGFMAAIMRRVLRNSPR